VKWTIDANELFDGDFPELRGIRVNSIEYDSRRVKAGSCFVAVKGLKADGHNYIREAVAKGAALVVAEYSPEWKGKDVPVMLVKNSKRELARLSERFYRHPSAPLGVVGITGTNGKTTVSYLVQALFNRAGFNTTRIGTIEYQFPDKTISALNTTPESADLQAFFAKAAEYENPRCVLEVSSHGLALGRLDYSTFKGAVFTNLTQDHLDFHHSMEDYRDTKKSFFTEFGLEYSVINRDDPTGAAWLEEGFPYRALSYGFSKYADIRVLEHETGWRGTRMKLSTPAGKMEVSTSMPGKHNASNVMAAVGVGVAENIPLDAVAEAVESVQSVPGRFEKVDEGQDFAVVVDYAHTDNALANLLRTAKEMTEGRLVCLFGCGGDRDRVKRKLMGKVAAQLADVLVVTSDNPRTENPAGIIKDILEGIPGRSPATLYVIESRKEAIEKALSAARKGDCVLIAGKGHETYQIIGTERHDFDDRKVAAEFLRRML
jgi:UDP-N-acetylmuramoyl-L-alanyl-D-glutamate--2,6-diaminopimelate ligase